jgi:hypothetical protein
MLFARASQGTRSTSFRASRGLVYSELLTFEDCARNIVLELFTHSRRVVRRRLR